MENKDVLTIVSEGVIEKTFGDYSKERKEILVFGAKAVLSTILGFIVITFFSSFLGVIKLALIAAITSGSLKVFSGGVHLPTYKLCALISGITFTFLGFLTKLLNGITPLYIILDSLIWFSFFSGSLIIYFYAPAEITEKPIPDSMKRSNLKVKSFLVFYLQCIIYFILIKIPGKYDAIALAGILGSLWQVFSITPLAYKLFNREYIRREG